MRSCKLASSKRTRTVVFMCHGIVSRRRSSWRLDPGVRILQFSEAILDIAGWFIFTSHHAGGVLPLDGEGRGRGVEAGKAVAPEHPHPGLPPSRGKEG